MNRVTATILSLALAASVGWAADPPGAEKPKEKTPAEVLYEKLLEANTKEADKAYAAYLKALDVANGKILAGLESAKKDLNDPKKGKLSITERAAAIAEIDKKIEEVKKGAVAEAVVASNDKMGDLLGDNNNTPKSSAISLLCSSKWVHKGQYTYEFKKNMTFAMMNRSGTFEVSDDGSNFTIFWNGDKNITEPGCIDGKTLTLSGSPLEPPKPKK